MSCNVLFCRLKFNREHETEECSTFLSTLDVHLVLQSSESVLKKSLKTSFYKLFQANVFTPILMYGLETLPLQKNQLNSLYFIITDIRIISV